MEKKTKIVMVNYYIHLLSQSQSLAECGKQMFRIKILKFVKLVWKLLKVQKSIIVKKLNNYLTTRSDHLENEVRFSINVTLAPRS